MTTLLNDAPESGNRDALLTLIDQLAADYQREMAPALLRLLTTTEDNGVRNASAMALSDLAIPELVPAVAKLLRDDTMLQHAGTLIYAVRNFDYAPILPELVRALVYGSYEAALMTLQLLDHLPATAPRTVIELTRTVLEEGLTQELTEDRRETVNQAITLLSK